MEMTAAQREIYKAVYSRNIQKLMSSGRRKSFLLGGGLYTDHIVSPVLREVV